jgi:hypothetical protein
MLRASQKAIAAAEAWGQIDSDHGGNRQDALNRQVVVQG